MPINYVLSFNVLVFIAHWDTHGLSKEIMPGSLGVQRRGSSQDEGTVHPQKIEAN